MSQKQRELLRIFALPKQIFWMNTDTSRVPIVRLLAIKVDGLFAISPSAHRMEVTLTDLDNLLEARDTFIADEAMEHPNYIIYKA